VEQLIALMALGAIAGLFSGLLGIGGGIIIVPVLTFMMPHFGLSGPELVKVAIATAMATTVVATFSGVQTHLSRGAVDWVVMRRLAPGIMVGAFAGPLLSEAIDPQLLTVIFIGFLLWSARAMVIRRASHEGFTGRISFSFQVAPDVLEPRTVEDDPELPQSTSVRTVR